MGQYRTLHGRPLSAELNPGDDPFDKGLLQHLHDLLCVGTLHGGDHSPCPNETAKTT